MRALSIIIFCLVLAGCATTQEKIYKTAKQNEKYLKVISVADKKDLLVSIAVFSNSLKGNSSDAGIYLNRAKAYFFIQDYGKSWEDVRKAQHLGIEINPEFLNALKSVSGIKG